jgi:hypothetical protein
MQESSSPTPLTTNVRSGVGTQTAATPRRSELEVHLCEPATKVFFIDFLLACPRLRTFTRRPLPRIARPVGRDDGNGGEPTEGAYAKGLFPAASGGLEPHQDAGARRLQGFRAPEPGTLWFGRREPLAASARRPTPVPDDRHRSLWPTLADVPQPPRCPHCEASVEDAETTEVVSSTLGGFRVILVACSNCHKVIGVGGLAPPSGGTVMR